MMGFRVNWRPLQVILKPLPWYLDGCWWHIEGHGFDVAEPLRVPGQRVNYEDPTYQELLNEQYAEAKRFTVATEAGAIGIPGFFSRFGNGLSSDWTYFCVSDAALMPVGSFIVGLDALRKSVYPHEHPPYWGTLPPNFPEDICLVVVGIDGGLWLVFLRDDWMYQTLWDYVRRWKDAEEI